MKYPKFNNINELISFINNNITNIIMDMTYNFQEDSYIEEIQLHEGPIDEYEETYGLSYEERLGYTDHIVEYREDIDKDEIYDWIKSGSSKIANRYINDFNMLITLIKQESDFLNNYLKDINNKEFIELININKDPISLNAKNQFNDIDVITYLYDDILS